MPRLLSILKSVPLGTKTDADPGKKHAGKWRPGFIGLELSHDKLHLLQLEFMGEGARIRAAVSAAYPSEREALLASSKTLRSFIKDVLRSKSFAGTRIVTCIPAEQLRLTPVTYKSAGGESESEAIIKLAKGRVDGDLNRWIVDYLPVRGQDAADGERAALLALAPRDVVVEHLEILRQAGLKTEALEIGPVAIRRVVTAMNSGDMEKTVLVINVARQNSYFTVVSGRRLILDREVDYSENKISEALGESLDMTPESALSLLYRYGVSSAPSGSINEEHSADSAEIARAVAEIVKPTFLGLAQEIRKVLAYTASQMRGAAFDQICLLGAIGRWPGADGLLGTILSLDVRMLNPFEAFATRTDAAVLEPLEPVAGMAIATGCALRRVNSDV